jgi:hypothetical protein
LLLFWELLALAGIGLGAVFALFGVCFPGPGLAPAGDFLFLRVQEKEAKEARPCCPYPLRFAAGQPSVQRPRAVPPNKNRPIRPSFKQKPQLN